ncbi:hypothetical protein SH528x_003306 [Novipirellula sp. SH528]|uniref:hypothetical protein n=1 Tax=Novipirellula sp. SH528 TaxID=3454466 RepID=UPI003F9F01B2
MSIASKLVAFAGVLCCSVASADLYTGHIASLEWKAHSSDAVLLVSVQSTSAEEATTKLIDVFAREGDEVSDAKSIANGWETPLRFGYQKDWKPDGDWLLFVRRWDDKEPTIDHEVFLKNPRQASWMSAVTADGKVLEDKQQILSVIKNRLAEGGRMTERQRDARLLVDRGKHPFSYQSESRGTPDEVTPWLGGFHITADIDIWDDPEDKRSFDESLWVNYITVPADEAYREEIFDYWISYLSESDDERRRITPGYPLFALVNYPGERTEQLLLHLQAVQRYLFDAQSALRYLRFHESEFDEDDQKLIGSWVLTTSSQRVQFDLMDNHELVAHRRPVPFPHPSKHQREWFAKGRWNLHYGKLRLMGTDLRLATSNRMHRQDAPLPQLFHLPIVGITDDAITFEKSVVLKKASKPIIIPPVKAEE